MASTHEPDDECNTDGFLSGIVPPALAALGGTAGVILSNEAQLPGATTITLTIGLGVAGYAQGKNLAVSEPQEARKWRAIAAGAMGTTGGIAAAQLVTSLLDLDVNPLVAMGVGGGIGFFTGEFVLEPLLVPGSAIGRGVIGLANSVSGLLGYGACEVGSVLTGAATAINPPPLGCGGSKDESTINGKHAFADKIVADRKRTGIKMDPTVMRRSILANMRLSPSWFGDPDKDLMVISPGFFGRLRKAGEGFLGLGPIGASTAAIRATGTIAAAGCMTLDQFYQSKIWKFWIKIDPKLGCSPLGVCADGETVNRKITRAAATALNDAQTLVDRLEEEERQRQQQALAGIRQIQKFGSLIAAKQKAAKVGNSKRR